MTPPLPLLEANNNPEAQTNTPQQRLTKINGVQPFFNPSPIFPLLKPA
jgi:hypothetical protein